MMLTMWTVLAAGSVAGQEPVVSVTGFAQRPSDTADGVDLKVTVYVSNFAEVPGTVLAQARQEAGRIYRAAGVTLEWADCAPNVEESVRHPACRPSDSQQNWVTLRLVSRSRMGGLRLGPLAVGLAAIPMEGGFGHVAFVCTECAEEALGGRSYPYGAIVGGLMAHEIGHLLLGTMRHSAVGLMRSPWNQEDWEHAAQGRMVFTRKEAERIGAQVRERTRHTARMVQVRESR
jgi:hypothetical protein